MTLLPGWQYPASPPKPGIWGEITSGENYCEEDYVITHLFAEFMNTTTNIAYLLYAWYGISKARRYRDFWTRSFPYIGIAGVGVMSAAFHGTVKLYAQWADDLSMFFAVGICLHQLYAYGHDVAYRRMVGATVTVLLTSVAVYHVNVETSTVHQASFFLMVVAAAIRTEDLINKRVKNKKVERKMRSMARNGTFGFLFAWSLWGLDNVFCDWFRATRRQIGLPWAHLLEFHGWWHVITAIVVYNDFVLIEHLTADIAVEENIKQRGNCAWPISRSLIRELEKPADEKED